MAPLAGSSSHEYWRPPLPEVMRLVDPVPTAVPCWRCGATYPPEARFCHICGSEREPGASTSANSASREVQDSQFTAPAKEGDRSPKTARLDYLRRHGPSMACLLFFLIGLACMIAAVLTGFIYKAQTLVEWQAVQIWRIEWLLGAAAALLAGVVLKWK